MKRLFKSIAWFALALVGLFLLAGALLYFPPIQRLAVEKIAAYAREQTGMDVSIGSVRLSFPLDLTLGDVLVTKPREVIPPPADTLLDVRSAGVDLRVLPLFKGRIDVDEFVFEDGTVNTFNLIESVNIEGRVGTLRLKSHGINLNSQTILVDDIRIGDSNISVRLNETAEEDTTSSSTPWRIDVRQLSVERSTVGLSMSNDTLQIRADIDHLTASDGVLDLGTGTYAVGSVEWQGGALSYDNQYVGKSPSGLDYNHLHFDDVSLKAADVMYSPTAMKAALNNLSFKEQSGVTVEDASGNVMLQGSRLRVDNLRVKTSDSVLSTSLDIDLDSAEGLSKNGINMNGHFLIGKQDVARLLPSLPKQLFREWPDEPMEVTADMKGDIYQLNINSLRAELPSAFTLSASGTASNLNDIDHLLADIDFSATTRNMNFATAMLDKDTRKSVRLPYGMSANGNLKVNGTSYQTSTTLRQGGGSMRLNGFYNTYSEAYDLHLSTNGLPLRNFLPQMELAPLTANLHATGRGSDFFARRSMLEAKADIAQVAYGGYIISDASAKVSLSDGRMLVDLQSFHVADSVLTLSMDGKFNVSMPRKDVYELDGQLQHLSFHDGTRSYTPDDVLLALYSSSDSTRVKASSGDLFIAAQASAGYAELFGQADSLMAESKRQWQSRRIDQVRLRERLPDLSLQASVGRTNIVSQLLAQSDYRLSELHTDLTSSHVDGLNGFVDIDTLIAAGIQLDKINLQLQSESDIMKYRLGVKNGKDNPQYSFNAFIDGNINESGSAIEAKLYDEHGELGMDMGLQAMLEPGGVRISLSDTTPLLGYTRFKANSDNFIYRSDEGRVAADLQLKAADGTGIQIYTDDDNEYALQDITIGVNRLDLERVLSVIPYMPAVSGLMNGDFHLIQTEDQLSVSSNISVQELAYEKSPIGNIGTEFVYIPKADGSHYVDGLLLKDDDEIGTLRGSYQSETGINATLSLSRLPLNIVNGFVPDRIVGLRGFAEGDLSLIGPVSDMRVDGEVFLSESALYSEPYGLSMRFADDPVRIENSRIVFENFELFANNDSPLNVVGYYDFSDFSRMSMDIRMRANDFLLIDAKENPRSEAFGKAYVNFYGSMAGPVENLSMRGKLDVLGTTDLSYILRDSELMSDNQLDELVKFTNFEDTTTVLSIQRPPISGFTMDLSVAVDEGAHLFCALNPEKTNYLDIDGGGDLRLRYLPTGDLSLTGRYTLEAGKMKYSLPVIPLKTFNIAQGSYIEFTGDVMNPTLHITATENVKATVGEGESSSRPVDFTCGVKLTQTLNDLGLAFVIDAPNDNAIRDELNTMSTEERGKVAITMLASGMYLADGNTSGFTMNSALSAFLQTEINNIAGSAMQSMGLGLSMGVDNTTNASGDMQTDYNFQFSKRLWSNRLSFIVGGKVSTGSDATTRDESIFDNVELEYRLNKSSSQYLRLFYDNNKFDWLEGMIGQYGAGFLWRRKLQHFKDIFRLKTSSANIEKSGKSEKSEKSEELDNSDDSENLKNSADSNNSESTERRETE